MQKNAELVEHLKKMYAVFESGDASSVGDLISGEKGILGIGTDPAEWWVDEAVARAFEAQVPEMHAAKLRFRHGDVRAHSDGSVGWVSDQPTLVLPGGEVPMRLTSVWRQEAGTWKMVQFHLSIGVPNEVAIGEKLTT